MTHTFAEVVIIWNVASSPPSTVMELEATASKYSTSVRIVVSGDIGFGPGGNPNHRYLPIPKRRTWCVYSVESGVIMGDQAIKDGFRTWQQYSDSIVGFNFEVRTLPRSQVRAAGIGNNIDLGAAPQSARHVVPKSCKGAPELPPNLILPAAVFFHGRFLHAYTYAFDIAGRDQMQFLISKAGRGADFMFPILVSLVSKQQPVIVDESVSTNTIPATTPALEAGIGSKPHLVPIESRLQGASLNGKLPAVMSVIWKGGEPRPGQCLPKII